jgi:primary-amine oxidase
MSQLSRQSLALFCLSIAALVSSIAHAATHPMDPLSEDEINQATKILSASGRVTEDALLAYMRLYEMPKAEVLAWSPGGTITRRAEAFIHQKSGFFRFLISLDKNSVENMSVVPDGQAPFMSADFSAANLLINNNKEWQDALRKRGITDTDDVVNITFSVGYFGDRSDKNKRLVRVSPYYSKNIPNVWGRPISGISGLIDLKANKVLEVLDTGVVPLPNGSIRFDRDFVGTRKDTVNKISYSQPGGPSFKIDNNTLKWQDWEMHFRVEQQNGLILSNVTFQDGEEKRSVLYQGAVSELFVPYMDPSEEWYSRTFIDAGEFGLGGSLSSLLRGADCPDNATLLDVVLPSIKGQPQTYTDVLAVFERYSGNPLVRHQNIFSRRVESRRNQELVVRTIATVGNYDYIFDWVFGQDGKIKVAVGATGICSAKAVSAKDATEAAASGADFFGRFVDEYTVAVNHSHFAIFRLDFDVDGQSNYFAKDMLKPVRFNVDTPRRSGWIIDSKIAETESDAQLRVNVERPALWRVSNSDRKNQWGNPTSYAIRPGLSHISLLTDDDWPQKRGAFSKYNLWVTPYDRDERFASGDFPNQSDGSTGIASWTAADRPIKDQDIVAWYSIGFHHLVRAEDWPIMNTAWFNFVITPYDFFDENPTMNLSTSD